MSLLNSILETIEHADGPVSLTQIALDLHIDPTALQAMIDYLVRKGRLRVVGAADGTLCAITGCATCSSAGPVACPLVVNAPTRYEVVNGKR